MKYYTDIFAQAYGAGTYSANCYNNAQTPCSTTASSAGLSNTGIMVAGVITIAAVILLVAIVVRVWRRPRKDAAPEIVQADDDANDTDDRDDQQG